jgi:hypothetical protein
MTLKSRKGGAGLAPPGRSPYQASLGRVSDQFPYSYSSVLIRPPGGGGGGGGGGWGGGGGGGGGSTPQDRSGQI